MLHDLAIGRQEEFGLGKGWGFAWVVWLETCSSAFASVREHVWKRNDATRMRVELQFDNLKDSIVHARV